MSLRLGWDALFAGIETDSKESLTQHTSVFLPLEFTCHHDISLQGGITQEMSSAVSFVYFQVFLFCHWGGKKIKPCLILSILYF